MRQYTSSLASKEHKDSLMNKKLLVLQLIRQSSQEDGISNREISQQLGIETATVSGLVRPLVKDGQVKELLKRNCKITGNLVIAWTVCNSITQNTL